MIIGTKRREEVLPRMLFKYKTVLVLYRNGPAYMRAFTTKKAAREFIRDHRRNTTASTCVSWIDLTGHPTLLEATNYWLRTPLLPGLKLVRDASDPWKFNRAS